MHVRTLALLLTLAIALPIQAHTFNHEDRHIVCEADVPPDHAADDGHAHWHHKEVAGAHFHGGVFHEAAHTHGGSWHDPCVQTGMDRAPWPDAQPLQEIYQRDAVVHWDPSLQTIITEFEGFIGDLQEVLPRDNLILAGDAMLDAYAAAGGMSGSGTRDDPYILEGHFIRNALVIKDTSRCIVIRDNVVHSRALVGPLFAPEDVIDLALQASILEAEVQETGAELEEARAAGSDLVDELESLLAVKTVALEDTHANLEVGGFEVRGVVSETVDQLAQDVADTLREQLRVRAGRMILDWNGQCLHAYNNIVEDLRVNQNNVRTGFATGGVLEDNRFYHIGQIRHYDGEFRENIVGYPEHLRGWLPGDEYQPMSSWVAMNTDGFNQGWFHHNTIFGAVDLDFHGHHHGAGFFSPESHYHGSSYETAYMVGPDGDCLAMAHDHGKDPTIYEGVTHLVAPPGHRCLPHHNHQLRWTSAVFEDNLVIDPFGYGIRYEDRNHQGDDRFANSEAMRELDAPHFHRTNVRVADNVVLGSLWVDIFNSPTIDVWSDDFSPVRYDIVGAALGAVQHLGARPITSHPERNSGWLEVQDNIVYLYDKPHNTAGFHYGWAAYQLNHIFEGDAIDLAGNQAYFVPNVVTASDDWRTIVTDLRDSAERSATENAALAESWGERSGDRPMSFAFVIHHLEDSRMEICDTTAMGFDVAVYAWNNIYDDSELTICDDNTFDAESHVRITSAPEERTPGLTEPLRGFTDDTSLEPLMRTAYTQIDLQEDRVRAQEAMLQRWSDAQMANAERVVDMQLANIDRIIAQQMYNADYRAAQQMAWADWQVGRQYSQAEYQAARGMGYVDWATMMAEKYTYGLPLV